MIHCRLCGRLLIPLLRAALLLIAAVADGAHAAVSSWSDLESRIQYAAYTEDTRTLGELHAAVAAMPEDVWRDYYLALTDYRLAHVAGSGAGAAGQTSAADSHRAGEAAAECVALLTQALHGLPDNAEYLALQAGCMDERVRLRPLDIPFTAARARIQMLRALQLAPANPRVQLLRARQDREHPAAAQDRARATSEMQQAVAAFERERLSTHSQPAWGLPEAYVELARARLDGGDALAAREALEHALLLVPDFVDAHRLLARITS